jgi:hypothetical protein
VLHTLEYVFIRLVILDRKSGKRKAPKETKEEEKEEEDRRAPKCSKR